jgi:uncharacterized protein (TIGR03435 family)
MRSMPGRIIGVLALTLAGGGAHRLNAQISGQVPTSAPAFEAASVKPNVSGSPRSGVGTMPGGRVTVTNQTLRQIIRGAFGSSDIEVIGGPDWIDRDRWDIVASAGTGDVDPPWRAMLKSLLAQRFMLQAHVESQERPIYALVPERADKQLGPRIHKTLADIDCKPGDTCGTTTANTNGIVSGTITGTARSMADIAQSLSPYAERRVFDRTGLEGRYDFDLQWSDIPIFTAVREQLGLKLEPARGPVDVVVVDRVERPTPD